MRRLEKVVLPEEEGPATSTMRASLERCITRLAISAMRCSWRASEIRINSLTRLAWMAVFNGADVFDAQAHEPIVVFAEGGQQLLGIGQRRQFVRRAGGAGKRSAKPPFMGAQGEPAEIPGGGDHVAVVVIAAVAELVEHQSVLAAELEQLDLLVLALRLEVGNGVLQRHDLALERQVGLDQLLHAGFDRRQLFLGERPAVDDRAVETARGQGVINRDVRGGEGVLEGGFEQEGDRTAVDARAVRVGHLDEPDAGIQFHRVGQFAQFAVDHRAHDGVVLVPFRQALQEGGDGPVARAAEDAAIGQEHFHGGSGDSCLVDIV